MTRFYKTVFGLALLAGLLVWLALLAGLLVWAVYGVLKMVGVV